MVRTKQTARLSSGPGQPRPLNKRHPQYAQNAQAAFDRAAAFVVRAQAALAAAGDADRATALQRVTAARRWRDHAEAEADPANGRTNERAASGAPPVNILNHDIAAMRLPFPPGPAHPPVSGVADFELDTHCSMESHANSSRVLCEHLHTSLVANCIAHFSPQSRGLLSSTCTALHQAVEHARATEYCPVRRELVVWHKSSDDDWDNTWHVEELLCSQYGETTPGCWPRTVPGGGLNLQYPPGAKERDAVKATTPRHGGRMIGNGYDGGERSGYSLCEVAESVFVLGGSCREWIYAKAPDDGTTLTSSDVVAFDTVTGLWSQCAPMGTPRMHHGAAALGESVYVMGGCLDVYSGTMDYDRDYQSGDAGLASVEVLDTITGEWKVLDPMPTPRTNLSCVTHAHTIYAIGGSMQRPMNSTKSRNAEMVVGVVEAFDTKTGTWRSLPSMPTPRFGHTSVYIEELGLICVAGGRTFGEERRYFEEEVHLDGCVEFFDVVAETWVKEFMGVLDVGVARSIARVCPCGKVMYSQGDTAFKCDLSRICCEYRESSRSVAASEV